MQTISSRKRSGIRRLVLSLSVLGGAACSHDLSSEERLDRETQSVALKEALGADDLKKVNCQDISADLTHARDENRPETDRVADYRALYASLKRRAETFERAFARNPDLAYQEGSQEFANARELCVQQTADVRVEFERYVRELVETPTVQEVHGGATVLAARLDFETLRQAIDALSPDDKEQLLSRVAMAEKRVEAAGTRRRR